MGMAILYCSFYPRRTRLFRDGLATDTGGRPYKSDGASKGLSSAVSSLLKIIAKGFAIQIKAAIFSGLGILAGFGPTKKFATTNG
jgi:hypothetical protein